MLPSLLLAMMIAPASAQVALPDLGSAWRQAGEQMHRYRLISRIQKYLGEYTLAYGTNENCPEGVKVFLSEENEMIITRRVGDEDAVHYRFELDYLDKGTVKREDPDGRGSYTARLYSEMGADFISLNEELDGKLYEQAKLTRDNLLELSAFGWGICFYQKKK